MQVTEFMQKFDEIWKNILSEADKNNDGKIDFSEF